MIHSLPRQLVGRFAAILFVMSGLVSVANHLLPRLEGMNVAGVAWVSLAAVAIGLAIWFAPWGRWPRSALFAIVPVALALKSAANLLGGVGPYSYGLHYVLIFSWIGLALPRWTSCLAAPLLVVSYLVPMLIRGNAPQEISSLTVVVPICLVIGESTAWVAGQLRRAEHVAGQRLAEMSELVAATLELAHLHGPRELADRVARRAADLLGGSQAAVLLIDAERTLRGAGGHGWPDDPGSLRLRPEKHPALARALRTKKLVEAEGTEAAALARALPAPALAILPLAGSGSSLGVVLVASHEPRRPRDAFQLDLGQTFATQAGLAFERSRATQALLDASLHDELTQVGNRRKAKEALRELRPGDAVALVDLDHFKRINDEHGHGAGDAVLKALGGYLWTAVRGSDRVFRWGGEEFLLLLASVGDDAEATAERLRTGWRREVPVTTFSAGVAVHRADRSPDDTIACADAALYAAKERGRDCVCAEPLAENACHPGAVDPRTGEAA